MDLDCIPTIESLLEQNAICFTGRPDLIDRYLVLMDLIIPIETMALLDDDFTVTAHVQCNNGYFDKLIHKKIGVNPKRLTHSLKAVTRAIDQSPAFFISTKRNKLIDTNVMSL